MDGGAAYEDLRHFRKMTAGKKGRNGGRCKALVGGTAVGWHLPLTDASRKAKPLQVSRSTSACSRPGRAPPP